MNTCAELFIKNLESKNLNYDVQELPDDETMVLFPYEGRSTHMVFAGTEGEHVQLITVIEGVTEEKYVDVVLACNLLNSKFRYVKFIVDKDNDVVALSDAILDPDSADEESFELLIRTLQIIKEAKPDLMRAIYS